MMRAQCDRRLAIAVVLGILVASPSLAATPPGHTPKAGLPIGRLFVLDDALGGDRAPSTEGSAGFTAAFAAALTACGVKPDILVEERETLDETVEYRMRRFAPDAALEIKMASLSGNRFKTSATFLLQLLDLKTGMFTWRTNVEIDLTSGAGEKFATLILDRMAHDGLVGTSCVPVAR